MKQLEILLVEDNPGDVVLTKEAFRGSKVLNIVNVAKDGEQALDMLFHRNGYNEFELPDLILLDINLPKIDGKEVLLTIKQDENLKLIPVIIFTTSNAEMDISECYRNSVNCYIVKPVTMEKFFDVIRSIENFWLNIVKLPGTII